MRVAAVLAVLVPLVLAGCGGDDEDASNRGTTSTDSSSSLQQQLEQATRSRAADFPAVEGRTLQEVADGLGAAGPQLASATSVLRPGTNRFAFGIIDDDRGFVYGPTAIYVARGADGPALGPFAAPADLLVTDPPFRSRQAATEEDPFAAVYEAQVPFDEPGTWAVLAATKVGERLVGSGTQVKVVTAAADRVPDVGEPAPRAKTDTRLAAGNIEAVDTRVPPDDLHDVELTEVLGRKPVALLFATPQLCQSRVCGPVVDIALQLRQQYGDRVAFIHQEVYVDNEVDKGLRAPLRAFNLRTEPWLFAIDAQGRIAARLEGSFGLRAMRRAVDAALR